MPYIEGYFHESVATAVLLILTILLRIFSARLIKRYAKLSDVLEHRTNLVIKYTSIFISFLAVVALFIIWSVEPDSILTTFSAAITIIGVAFFAQWSVLSNITSGFILLFSFPFKIGDIIKIHDKDFPIEAEIEDIRTFHTILKTKEGEIITYPNNLMLQKGISIIQNYYEEKEFTD